MAARCTGGRFDAGVHRSNMQFHSGECVSHERSLGRPRNLFCGDFMRILVELGLVESTGQQLPIVVRGVRVMAVEGAPRSACG